MKSHTSAVQLKIVSGKQKGKILKHSEIVAHKQKGVRGSGEGRGGGGGWEEDFFSRQLQAFINEKKIHWTSCYCLNCLNPLTVQMVSDHNT